MRSHRLFIFSLSFFAIGVFSIVTFVLAESRTHAEAIVIYGSGSRVIQDITVLPSNGVPGMIQLPVFFDFYADDSFQRYLSPQHPFANLEYKPVDLTPIDSDFTANKSYAFSLRQEPGIYFADLAWHFWNDFKGDRLGIISAWRSRAFQDSLVKRGCSLTKCAQAGTSEHQAGLALDLNVLTRGGRTISLDLPNKYTDRLKANAYKYGFHNTYQKGIEIDGKIVEGRHRRYVGIDLATILYQNGQTIAEYYNQITM